MTTNPGFDKPLYILSFDDRDLLQNLSVSDDTLTDEHAAQLDFARSQVVLAKHVVFDGFNEALDAGVPKEKAAIQVDEYSGADILRSAAERGYLIACPTERSSQNEFQFEYGDDFAQHIEEIKPAFCKVQVRYNPDGDPELNKRQTARLKQLSDYLHGGKRSLLLLELLVPHTAPTVAAIQQLLAAQVEPDVWAVEGFDNRADYEKVVAAVRAGGRDKVGCIVLGGSNDKTKVTGHLELAAQVPGFIGFSVSRTVFSGPLSTLSAGAPAAQAASTQIGRTFRELVSIFEKA